LTLYLTGQEFEINFVDLNAREDYLLSTVELILERSSRQKEGEDPKDNIVVNQSMQVSIKKGVYSSIVIGNAKSEHLQQKWGIKPPENKSSLVFYLTVDNYTLSQIEKIRGEGDLYLSLLLQFQAFVSENPEKIQPHKITLENILIYKSKWVENVLSRLNYKNVALVEIPKLQYEKLDKAINLLNLAWKSYSTGDTDQVLVNCRKALEAIGQQVKKAGFEKEDEEIDKKGQKYTSKRPDWKKFFDSNSKGEIVKTITQKMFDFVAPGAHIASILEMNHACFAVLQVFSLTHVVISRFKMMEDMTG
jgi:hypothetical protein